RAGKPQVRVTGQVAYHGDGQLVHLLLLVSPDVCGGGVSAAPLRAATCRGGSRSRGCEAKDLGRAQRPEGRPRLLRRPLDREGGRSKLRVIPVASTGVAGSTEVALIRDLVGAFPV